MILDSEILESFTTRFYGYGDLAAKTWFIGMEEGGGNSSAEIASRIDAWERRGRKELEDLVGFHAEAGIHLFLEEPVRLQRTWAQLIRIHFSMTGRDTSDLDAMRQFQVESLGRSDGDVSLLELMPLPSPSIGTWTYGELTDIEHLETRDAYKRHLMPSRAAALKELVRVHQPEVVVFYGASGDYREQWQNVASTDLIESLVCGRRTWFGSTPKTQFAATQHPSARGITNDYFAEVGRLLAQ